MRARILRPLLASLLVLAVLAPAASAGSPKPSGPPTSQGDFAAGETCSFAVHTDEWSRVREWTRRNLTVYIGPAVTRLTNVDHPARKSVTVKTNGIVKVWSLRDGSQRIVATGTTLFYFFPGDVTPDGGDDGGWFLITGHVRETLSADNIITKLSIHGRYRDLCRKID